LLQGNPGKRPLNANEPKPKAGVPRCPDWLDDEAKLCWKRTSALLKNLGVITVIDGDALAVYCETWSHWKRTVIFLQKNGDVYTVKDAENKVKYVAQLPQVAIARNLLAALNRYQQEFGLTPASRSRLVIGEEDSSSGIAEFLGFSASRSA
jgi:P27 family predicted phage terminase small subunit